MKKFVKGKFFKSIVSLALVMGIMLTSFSMPVEAGHRLSIEADYVEINSYAKSPYTGRQVPVKFSIDVSTRSSKFTYRVSTKTSWLSVKANGNSINCIAGVNTSLMPRYGYITVECIKKGKKVVKTETIEVCQFGRYEYYDECAEYCDDSSDLCFHVYATSGLTVDEEHVSYRTLSKNRTCSISFKAAPSDFEVYTVTTKFPILSPCYENGTDPSTSLKIQSVTRLSGNRATVGFTFAPNSDGIEFNYIYINYTDSNYPDDYILIH